MSAVITTRRAEAADVDRILAFIKGNALPTAGVEDQLGSFLLAEKHGTLIGCAAVESYGRSGLLRSVAVAPDQRGGGVAKTLVEACINASRSAGHDGLYLLTETAQLYFPRFGFRVVERNELPTELSASAELRGACPASAIAMELDLNPEGRREKGKGRRGK